MPESRPDDLRDYRLAPPQGAGDNLFMLGVVCDRDVPDAYGLAFYFVSRSEKRVRVADQYHVREGFPIAGIYQGLEPVVAGQPFWVVYSGPASSETLEAQGVKQILPEVLPA
jgi:hypothetical protein